jgi:hypothetical protein
VHGRLFRPDLSAVGPPQAWEAEGRMGGHQPLGRYVIHPIAARINTTIVAAC